MKAKDLKNSILQLAVQGKLVEQDPNDEPASVLIERIREARAKLIKEKKIKAPKGGESVIYRASDGSHYEKRIDAKGRESKPACIDDEIPFEIPESWEWVRISSSCTSIIDCPHSTPTYLDADTGYYAIDTNCINDDWERTGLRCLSKKDYEKRISRLAPIPGDLIFTREGSIGRSFILDVNRVCLGQRVLLLRVSDLLTPNWLQLNLSSPSSWEIYRDVNVGTGVKHINVSLITDLLIPIPPLAEQRRIVELVERLMPLVEEYGRLEDEREELDASLTDHLRKSVLHMAVQGKLVAQDPLDEPASELLERIREERRQLIAEKKLKVPKGGESIIYRASDGGYYEKRIDAKGRESKPACIDDEIPFEIPENWEWCRLGSFTNLQIGKTPPRSEPAYWLNGMVPWVSISDMKQNETLTTTKEKVSAVGMAENFKRGTIPAGTLLMSFKLTIGRTCVLGIEAVHNEAIVSIQPYQDQDHSQRNYLQLFMPYLVTFGDSKDAIKGATLNKDSLTSLLVPIPPLAEQRRIVQNSRKFIAQITR